MKRTRGMFGKRLLVVALTASMLTGTVDVTTLQAAAQTKQQEETENLTVNTPDEVSVRTIMDVPEQQEIDTEIEEPENEQPGKDEEQPEAGDADGKEESAGAENPDNPDEDAPEEIPDEEAGETEENPDKAPGEETDGKETTEGERAALSDEYGTQISTGETGECIYTIYDTDADGTGDLLVISGEGAMAGYAQRDKSRPWIDGTNVSIRKLLIKYGVTGIGGSAFYNFNNGSLFNGNLTTVEVETRDGKSKLEWIGDRAFYGSSVTQMNFPEGLNSIGEGAFMASEIPSVQLPMGLVKIGDNAFRTSRIESIVIPPTVTYIGGSAFSTSSGYPSKTVYYLCDAREVNSQGNAAYKITMKVDDKEVAARYVLPEDIASGTAYAGTEWDAANGFPYLEEETPYTWIESESGTRYTQTDKAEITGNMTFNRYTYEMRAVTFHMEHVTTDGETAFKLSEGGSEDYICTLTPEKDYLLTKSDITVEVGEETLAPADYIYNAESGMLTIPREHITDDMVITAKAVTDVTKCVVSLTKDGEVTNYFTLEDAAQAVDGSVTLTLLKDCAQKEDISFDGTEVTFDLNGKTLTVEKAYLQIIGKGKVMSSAKGGQVKGNIVQQRDNELTLCKDVSVQGTVHAGDGTSQLWIEGAAIQCLTKNYYSGQIFISSGSVEEISWKGIAPVITGGTIGSLISHEGGKRTEAFPDGYAVKNPQNGKLYTRAQIDGENFTGRMTPVKCSKHANDSGFCKYCNTKTVCEHKSADKNGKCKKCGMQFCAEITAGKQQTYFPTWEELCDRVKTLTADDTVVIWLYQDQELQEAPALELAAGTVVLDLGGHSYHNGNGSLLKVSGTADITLQNGTAIGSDKPDLITVSGGRLKVEKSVILSCDDKTFYGYSLRAIGGDTEIDGTQVPKGSVGVDGGKLTILDGTFSQRLAIYSGEVKLCGGTYTGTGEGGSICIARGGNRVGDLLQEGFAFRSIEDNSWIRDDRLDATSIYNVKVQKIPVAITEQPQSIEAFSGKPVELTVGTDTQEGVSYQWYRKGEENSEAVEGATKAALKVPGQEIGTEAVYYCEVTCDGYTVESEKATVSFRCDLADCLYKPVADQLYTGEPARLQAKDILVYPKGAEASTYLNPGEDFQILEESYQNNDGVTEDGKEACVTIKGIGNYGGELVIRYRIVNQEITAEAVLKRMSGSLLTDINLWTKGVMLYAPEGYQICETADGSYEDYFTYNKSSESQEGTIISYYLKDQATGGVSARKQVRVKVDADQPSFEKGGIEIKGSWWKTLLSDFTFGAFFRDDTVDVYIKADDVTSGVGTYYYYIEEIPESMENYRVKTDSELDKLDFTKVSATEKDKVRLTGLSDEKRYVIYAIAYDNAQNASGYICTEGVVIDRKAPEIDPENAWKTGGVCTESSIEYVVDVPEDCTLYYQVVLNNGELPDNDADKAEVLFAAGEGVGTAELSAGVSHFTVSGLKPNRSYSLWYAAQDRAGNRTEKAKKKAVPDLTAKGETKILDINAPNQVYNGAAYAYRGDVRVENTWKEDITDKLEIDISYSGTLMDGTSYGQTKEAPTQAGRYKLTVTAVGVDYEGSLELPFEIEKARVLIRANDVQLAPGDELPQKYTYTVTGLIGEDKLIKEPFLYCSAVTTTNEGEYQIIPSSAEADRNYLIYYQQGVLRITEELLRYTVSFDLMGHGSFINPYTDIKAGSLIEEPKTPEESGYRFEGWYTDRERTKTWNFAQDAVSSDMMLYAGWLEETVTAQGDQETMYVREIPMLTYTGSPLKPTMTVYDGDVQLKAGKDYTVSYQNNKNASRKTEEDSVGGSGSGATPAEAEQAEGSTFRADLPYAKITGKGNYSGNLFVNFVILPAELTPENTVLTCKDQNVVNKKSDQKPFGSVKYRKKGLKAKTDFTVTLRRWGESEALKDKKGNPIIPKGESGRYVLEVEGTGNYCGRLSQDIEVKENSSYLIKNAKISLGKNQSKVSYTAGGVVLQPAEIVKEGKNTVYYPIVDKYGTRGTTPVDAKDCYTVSAGGRSLVYGQDYTASYNGNDRTGKATLTISGIGAYAGTKSMTFTITGTAVSAKNVMVKEGTLQESMTYTGSPITQNKAVLVYNNGKADERELVYGVDYRITYRNNSKAGKAEMTFTMRPEAGLTGKVVKTFKITKVNLNDENVQKSEAITAENLTAAYCKGGAKPDGQIVFTYQGKTLTEGVDYTIAYANNKTVTATEPDSKAKVPKVTVKGKGNFEGTLILNYRITLSDLKQKYENGLVEIGIAGVAYDAKKKQEYLYKPKVTVKEGKATLKNNTDYTIEYMSNDQAAFEAYLKKVEEIGTRETIPIEETPRIVLTPKGSYSGEKIILPLQIGKTVLSAANLYIVVDEQQTVYTGKQVKPAMVVYYSADKNAIKKAKKSKTVLSEEELTKADGDYRFTKLTQDRDYRLVYGVNVTAGKNKGTVTVSGAGPLYGGSLKMSFNITGRNIYRR